MSSIVDSMPLVVRGSTSPLAFHNAFSSTDAEHGRFVTIDGRHAYVIGTGCDTCPLLFERLGGSNQKISPATFSSQLRWGITSIASIDSGLVGSVLPNGDYEALLLEIRPQHVELGSSADYFVNEALDVWGLDPFWGLPHNPKTEYYRCMTQPIDDGSILFEFIVPLLPPYWLDKSTVALYRQRLAAGDKPTALSVSVLDVRAPAVGTPGKVRRHHWSLIHLLLDGHHKIHAAALTGRPITLLSFYAPFESIARADQFETLTSVLGRKAG